MLREAFRSLKKKAAPGVDGQTWKEYNKNREANLHDLSRRLRTGAYRARPVQRKYIPKADGKQRPLGITALEDKIVQKATIDVLNAIYEVDFLGFSYGFRPGRHQHNALDALYVAIDRCKVSWVFDADISGYFDAIDHSWLMKFVEHRIRDKRVLRLIQKWLKAGVLDEDKYIKAETGTPQGGNASPLLANLYLHYVFDLWANWWRRKRARGEVIIVRFADDFIVGFEHQSDAKSFKEELEKRLSIFNLTLHPTKTRLIAFGRYAAERRQKAGLGKPESFEFLGFQHICGKDRRGKFKLIRHTSPKRLRGKLREIKEDLRKRKHDPIPEVGQWLGSVVRGHVQYYGVPSNSGALSVFRGQVSRLWYRCLKRRSQKHKLTIERMKRLSRTYLPPAHICHPYPSKRLQERLTRSRSPVL